MPTAAQLKVLVADPPIIGGNQIFPDEHYELIASMEPNTYKAAGNAARTLAAYFAQKVSVTAGPVKIESSDKSEHYLKLAKQYDDLSKTAGNTDSDGNPIIIGGVASGGVLTGTEIPEIESVRSDPDRYDSAFYRGLDDPNSDCGGDE